jgi:hypothetical protein
MTEKGSAVAERRRWREKWIKKDMREFGGGHANTYFECDDFTCVYTWQIHQGSSHFKYVQLYVNYTQIIVKLSIIHSLYSLQQLAFFNPTS